MIPISEIAGGESFKVAAGPILKEYDIATNGISLHVTEQGRGPAVLFCHGFPDTSYTWRKQMKAVASAGYRAIAPDMRGYGRTKPNHRQNFPRLLQLGCDASARKVEEE